MEPTLAPRPPSTWVALVFAALLAGTALVPRVISTDRAYTTDEFRWIKRSDNFVETLQRRRPEGTIQSGHPGVTTMWIGGLAQQTLPDDAPSVERLARARIWIAVVDVALIMLIWVLAGPLLGFATASVGALLLALDPFVLAHNRVLHLDGLVALLMTASVLALMRAPRSRSMTIVSGALAGLAVLTKLSGVWLIPVAFFVLVLRESLATRKRPKVGDLIGFAAWCGAMLVVLPLLWPGLWSAPGAAISTIRAGGQEAFLSAHAGGYFLGRQVDDPGPLFYPTVLAWRSSALVLPAVIATIVWVFRRRRTTNARAAATLLLFAAGFVVMMTLGAKKGDRYILPAFPPLDLVAAIGIVAAGRALSDRPVIQRLVAVGRLVRPAIGLTVAAGLALHAGPALALHPYELAHYNLALGGSATGRHVFLVGWGEGLDLAAAYLNGLGGASHLTVEMSTAHELDGGFSELFVGHTRRPKKGAPRADYAVFYMPRVMRGLYLSRYEPYSELVPVWHLDVNGLPYVRVYEAL